MASENIGVLFHQVVSTLLNSWPGLQIALEHGFGGANSKQKAQELVNDVESLFHKKGYKIDPYDFMPFLEDEVDDRFDLLLEDGSVQMIAHHVCQCAALLREGKTAQVRAFLEGLPKVSKNSVVAAGGDDSSDEDDEEVESMDQVPEQSAVSSPAQPSTGMPQDMSAVNGSEDAPMDCEEEEEGWTTVRKNRRKR